MFSVRDLFGSTSMQEKENHTPMRKPLRKQYCYSAWGREVGPPYSLDLVEVSIAIGRWSKAWTPLPGPDTRQISRAFVIDTNYTLTPFALRIYRRYSVPLPPTTEKATTRPSSDGAEVLDRIVSRNLEP